MSKKVVISGAAGNLGQAVTQQFIREGYTVTALTQPAHTHQAESLKKQVGAQEKLHITELDVLDEKAVEAFVGSAGKDTDAAVLLVGGFAMGGIAQTDEQLLDQMISLNFKSVYHLARQFFTRMAAKGGGRIVLVGARAAIEAQGGNGVLAYTISKTMVVKLAQILNVEGKSKNVVTSIVVPNIIDTPQNRADMPNADFTTWVKPEEIARIIAFACSAEAAKLDEPVYKIYGHQ